MRAKFLKITAFLLAMITVLSMLAACANDTSGSESGSDSESVNETDTEYIPEEGVLTLFAAGAYRAKVIRSDSASQLEMDFYNQLRKILKNRVGEMPAIDTDFVANGEEKYDGPAILVGETKYTESKTAYSKLGEGEASATYTGSKYVLAFANQDAANNLITKIKEFVSKKGTKTAIKIDDAWKATIKLQYYTSGTETFNPAGLGTSAKLPSNLGNYYDGGKNDSAIYIKKNADKAAFDNLCKEAETNGFKKYTSTTIGVNHFATYVTQSQILHFMFFPNKGEIRTAVDKRGSGTGGYTLPGLSGENRYASTHSSLMTLVEIENSSWPGGMCLIFKLCDGRFVIVDSGIGGRDNDGSSSGWIYATLAKHADDPENINVAAWITTHIHSDHAGGLYDMANGTYQVSRPSEGANRTHNVMPRECREWIKIDTLIYNQPERMVSGRSNWMDTIINKFGVKKVIKAHPGQIFYYANLKITMYGSQDIMAEYNDSVNDHNEQSLTFMAEFNGKKFLILGDSYPKNTAALATIYKESLKADIVQTSHHGYDNTDAHQVYAYAKASMVIWPVASYEMKDCDLKNAPVNAIFKGVPDNMQFAPHGGNIDFDENWKPSSKYRVYSDIPYCDCSWCKNQPNKAKTSGGPQKSKSSNF